MTASRESRVADSLEHELCVAEAKAWDALGRYKFQMFGYWAAIWIHLNRVGEFGRPNPWRELVSHARRYSGTQDSAPPTDGEG